MLVCLCVCLVVVCLFWYNDKNRPGWEWLVLVIDREKVLVAVHSFSSFSYPLTTVLLNTYNTMNSIGRLWQILAWLFKRRKSTVIWQSCRFSCVCFPLCICHFQSNVNRKYTLYYTILFFLEYQDRSTLKTSVSQKDQQWWNYLQGSGITDLKLYVVTQDKIIVLFSCFFYNFTGEFREQFLPSLHPYFCKSEKVHFIKTKLKLTSGSPCFVAYFIEHRIWEWSFFSLEKRNFNMEEKLNLNGVCFN